jgi:hypothetical protein
MSIKSIEWLGTHEADKLVVKSEWMKEEIIKIYKAQPSNIRVIPPNSENWLKEILETYRSTGAKA